MKLTQEQADLVRLLQDGCYIVSPIPDDDQPAQYYLKNPHLYGRNERVCRATVRGLIRRDMLDITTKGTWLILKLIEKDMQKLTGQDSDR